MSMFSIFDIAGSALSAQSERMNVTASNLANADTTSGPDNEAYRARQVVFETQYQDGSEVGGVRVSQVIEDGSPMRQEYRPGDPLADESGYVTMPNVEPVGEMVNMISASRSYQANVEVMAASKELMLKTLTLGEA
ncbi:flagellar basal body rod protein FlgC [Pseudomonas putida]|jgi:flagellar basal-body rod protein FlgC|uniref:Flagellar basal-body rod protein FlgC n=1 Tax=Pseudomonas putida TaxID=303 RepID=A0A7Y7Z680_PSEPU|nr:MULTISPECIES: flagellar basal body rod protein FlgC [Pseudomonas]QPN45705.1 flagellar basal body rod protein FlgC [Priestia aryabhattai]KAF1313058.1 flagellar basal body rod protein FlgC [Pseudomonas sp. SG-MS2]MBG6125261.1 flagellar basal-body rod protein FlgC [Pseudomonas sp. M2]NSX18640.1 flagellar basal body rod protein FlgC [Pseudomonas putida]NWC78728.1 flagellar basal body rod protein FlgC [Pseudomonas putida]